MSSELLYIPMGTVHGVELELRRWSGEVSRATKDNMHFRLDGLEFSLFPREEDAQNHKVIRQLAAEFIHDYKYDKDSIVEKWESHVVYYSNGGISILVRES